MVEDKSIVENLSEFKYINQQVFIKKEELKVNDIITENVEEPLEINIIGEAFGTYVIAHK